MPENPSELVLVVDDNPVNVQLLGAQLSREGYLIAVARSGEQALEAVARQPPDIILLDVMMPGIDGFETCTRLHADPASRDIPVIFLTARTEKEATVAGFEAGAVDYVTKPFDAAELRMRVRTQLELRRRRRELTATLEALQKAHDERQRMQEQLLETERRKTLLETAGGAAHEISQPLQAVSGQIELALLRLSDGHEVLPMLEAALEQVERIADIMTRMKKAQRYATAPYVNGSVIIDFEGASEAREPA